MLKKETEFNKIIPKHCLVYIFQCISLFTVIELVCKHWRKLSHECPAVHMFTTLTISNWFKFDLFPFKRFRWIKTLEVHQCNLLLLQAFIGTPDIYIQVDSPISSYHYLEPLLWNRKSLILHLSWCDVKQWPTYVYFGQIEYVWLRVCAFKTSLTTFCMFNCETIRIQERMISNIVVNGNGLRTVIVDIESINVMAGVVDIIESMMQISDQVVYTVILEAHFLSYFEYCEPFVGGIPDDLVEYIDSERSALNIKAIVLFDEDFDVVYVSCEGDGLDVMKFITLK